MNKNITTVLLIAVCLCSAVSPMAAQENYVKTETATGENTKIISIQYYDGLGRPSVAATNATTGTQNYVYSLQTYDAAGRASDSWLPEKSGAPTTCPSAANVQAWSKTTNNDDAHPFAHTDYDALDRPTSVQNPGANWQGKAVKTTYGSNAAKSVKRYVAPITSTVLSQNGYYDANTLYQTITTDEDGRIQAVFTDKDGRKILERRDGDNDTYFVYNDYGELRFVLSPMYQESSNLEGYGYEYRYDERGCCVYKRLPGCDAVTYTYDTSNRLATMQDGVMKSNGQMRFYLQDSQGRPVLTGLCGSVTQATVIADVVTDGSGICGTNYKCRLVPSTSYGKITGEVTLETATYYDDYDFLGTFPASVFTEGNASYSKTRPTGQVTGIISPENGKTMGYEYTVWHYDEWGNCTKEIVMRRAYNYNASMESTTAADRKDITTITYSYTDKPLTQTIQHFATPKATTAQYTETLNYTYTTTDQLQKVTHRLNNGTTVTIVNNTYDDLGRLQTTSAGSNTKLKSTYNYNLRGWLTKKTSPLFSETLEYENPTVSGAVAQFGGNISAMRYTSSNYSGNRNFSYTYDGLDRLIRSAYTIGTTPSRSTNFYKDNYTEEMEYDQNGNITHLTRNGALDWSSNDSGLMGTVDDVDFFYDGNQLKMAWDSAEQPTYKDAFHYSDQYYDPSEVNTEYKYDKNGRMTQNLDNNISLIQYNSLNLPTHIKFVDESMIENIYNALGQKLATRHTINTLAVTQPLTGVMQGSNIDGWKSWMTSYVGNMEFEDGTPKKIYFDGGYIDLKTKKYYFYVTDHLGSIREVADLNGNVVQHNEYYATGGIIPDLSSNADFQSYKFQGKEFDRIHGLNWNDHGARFADLTMCRWTTMDPHCESYYNVSPYTFCHNNFVNIVDLDGMDDYFDENGKFLKHTDEGSNVMIRYGNDNFVNITQYNFKDNEAALGNIGKHFLGMVDKNSFELSVEQSGGNVPLDAPMANSQGTNKYTIYMKEDGSINSSFGDANNFTSIAYHESRHRYDKSTHGGTIGEVNAVLQQTQHESWYGVTDDYAKSQAGYAAFSLNLAIRQITNLPSYLQRLNTAFFGYASFTNDNGVVDVSYNLNELIVRGNYGKK